MTGRIIFWSSVDAALFMRAVVDAIRAEGLPAEHRFAVSNTAYRNATTSWDRLVLRVRMYIEYPLRLAWVCYRGRGAHTHVVTTNTFYAPWVAILFAGRDQSVVHLVWDLFPDALIEGKHRANRRWVIQAIECIVQHTFSRASANVFLGQRLLAHARSRFRDVPRAHIIPVGADARIFATCPPHTVGQDEPVDILYCGNLGTMHDTTTILDALQQWDWHSGPLRGLALSFHSSGPLYANFSNKVCRIEGFPSERVRLYPSLGDVEWAQRMKHAHVALVTMKPGSENVVMPSKTYSALAAGQAILAVCPRESDLARLVHGEDCGWVVAPGCLEELRAALEEIATRRDLLHTKRDNAFRVGQSKYSDAAVGREWVRLLEKLSPRSKTSQP